MSLTHRLVLALGLAGAVIAPPAFADDPTFFNESQPMFDNCGDGSLAKAQKEGITLGFSNNPPEAWLDEQTKQPTGIDWDINKAALDWAGIKTIQVEWMRGESH